MKRPMDTGDDLHLLAAGDPERVNPVAETADAERLARLRARVDTERRTVTPAGGRSSPWPRRGALLAVAAAVAIAVPVVVSAVVPDGPVDQAVSPQALAVGPDGSLRCTDPYFLAGEAVGIDPRSSEVRLLPSDLPPGWSLTTVFARIEQNDISRLCLAPSLSVVETAGDVVTGTLSVVGPFEARVDEADTETGTVFDDAEALDDTVDGRGARLFVVGEVHQRWLWQDDRGRSWLAEVMGHPIEEARALVAGVGTDGDQVTWDAAVAPDARVAHRRTGPPYAGEPAVTHWHVGLNDGTQEVGLRAIGRGGPDIPLLARATPGDRLVDAGGVEFLVTEGVVEEEGIIEELGPGIGTEVPPGSRWTWAKGDLASGVTVAGQLYGTADDLLPLLTSLEQVPADDPRIAQHALDEEYGPAEEESAGEEDGGG